jgi:phage terminase large subunit-like protein
MQPIMQAVSPETIELVPPRFETPRPSDVGSSYGADAAAWIRLYLGIELFPWQRYALERILERRDDGSLRWRRVILTVARQSGKSVLSRGLCSWRLGAADLFGGPQDVISIANVRETARRHWVAAAGPLERAIGAKVRRSNGQEALELLDGSRWTVAAATLDGGVGSSLHLAFVDEGWRISRQVVDGSLAPALLATESPQLILVSTAGDGGSELLIEERRRALDELHDPDAATTLLLEWSAPADADHGDRAAWRMASPQWSRSRIAALEHAHATTSESEFARQYLNIWQRAAQGWIPPSAWAQSSSPAMELPARPAGTVAINDAADGAGYAYCFAVADGDTVKIRGRVFGSRRELWAELELLAAERRGLTLLYPASFEQHVAKLAGVELVKVATAEQKSGFAPTRSAIADGRLVHDGDEQLTEHVLTAVPVTIPDMGTTLNSKRSPGPIYAARAMVWAVGHELRTDRKPRALVVAG